MNINPNENIIVDQKFIPTIDASGISEGNIEISDFFGVYPELDDEDFNSKIQRKQEFIESRSLPREPAPKRGENYNRQIFMARYFFNYRSGLIIDDPGTGKSCLFIQIIELHRL